MKKRLLKKELITFLALFFVSLSLFSQSQIVIGPPPADGMDNTIGPIHRRIGTMISRHAAIYKASEVNLASGATITDIAWFKNETGSHNEPDDSLIIYFKHTSDTVFSSASVVWADIVPAAENFNQTGVPFLSTDGYWFNLTLDDPFIYNGTDNLMVLVEFHKGGSVSFSSQIKWTFQTVVNASASESQTNIPENMDRHNYRPSIRFTYESYTEPTNQVTNLAAVNVTTTEIPLVWTPALPGTQAPQGYLIKLSEATINDPVNGVDTPDTLVVTGGKANKKVTPATSVGTSSFLNMQAGKMYYFKNYSYVNSSNSIIYNTNAVPHIYHATLPNIVTNLSFNPSGAATATINWLSPVNYDPVNHSVLVFVKPDSPVNVGNPSISPVLYTPNTNINSGTTYEHDVQARCVYSGDGNSVSVDGLDNDNTAYHILVLTVVDMANSNLTHSYSDAVLQSSIPQNLIANSRNDNVQIFPNPANTHIKIVSSQMLEKIDMFNILGELMFSFEINAKETTINVESFANGIYFLEMVSDNKKNVRKIIIEK